MNVENKQRWLAETETERTHRHRRLQEEAERSIERLHREYFEPFDRLLERKAEYALKIEQEKGEMPPWLLQEIEILEKFRSYVVRLDGIHEDQAFGWFIALKQEVDYLQRRCDDLNLLAWTMQENEKFMGEMLIKTLEKIKNIENGRTVRP